MIEVQKRFSANGLPLLDPVKDMRIPGPEIADIVSKMEVPLVMMFRRDVFAVAYRMCSLA